MRHKKVVYFVNTAPAVWGAEHSMLSIASELQEVGWSVHLLAGSEEVVEAWRAQVNRNTVLFCSRLSVLFRSISLIIELLKLPRGSTVVTFEYDLVPVLGVARPLLRLRSLRAVFDLHVTFGGARTRTMIRGLSRCVDLTVCVSQFVALQLSHRAHHAVIVRPMGPGSVSWNPGSQVVVGIVGRIDPEKRPDFAIRACAQSDTDCRVILRGAALLGTDSYLEEVLALGLELLGDRFSFEGQVAKADALAHLDFLLLANEREPSGRVVAEAQLAGVVPLVPSSGGSAEFVEPSVSGERYPALDLGAATACLDAAVASYSEQLRRRMIEIARDAYSPRTRASDYSDALDSAWLI